MLAIFEVKLNWKSPKFLKLTFTKSPFPEDPLHAHEQLPRVVQAIGYDFQVEPFFPFPGLEGERDDLTFQGNIYIHFHVLEATQYVLLNAENLEIKTLKLFRQDVSEAVTSIHFDVDKSQIKVTAVNWFMPGENHTLGISYEGPLYSTQDGGFFYYTYGVDKHHNKTVVATVFEPAMAR